MKDDIIELRKLGLSYNQIKNKLGCSKSTIFYHCKNNNLHGHIKLNNNINIKDINIVKKEKKIKRKKICINCNKEINNNKFCSPKCSSDYRHKESYLDFLKNNDSYCRSNYTPKAFKDFFLKEQNNKCLICGINNEWEGKELIFVIDHIDGDASNNMRNNLRLICPNCDSQTDTFKSKNKKSKRRNYWKENIISKYVNKED